MHVLNNKHVLKKSELNKIVFKHPVSEFVRIDKNTKNNTPYKILKNTV